MVTYNEHLLIRLNLATNQISLRNSRPNLTHPKYERFTHPIRFGFEFLSTLTLGAWVHRSVCVKYATSTIIYLGGLSTHDDDANDDIRQIIHDYIGSLTLT